MPKRFHVLLPIVLGLLAAPAARASDGVIEINATCATQTGCFPGDAPGYPVEITLSGSYRLTSNLGRTVPQTLDADFIHVGADDVTLDLGGFTISCRSLALGGACTGSASGVGVDFSTKRTTVRNGTIRGMPGPGVSVEGRSRVEGVSAIENGVGIIAQRGSIVSSNIAHGNHGTGINVTGASIVSGNTVSDNEGHGIESNTGDVISGNIVSGNGTGAFGGYGLRISLDSAYRANAFTDNATGPVSGGINRGDNYCAGPGTVSSLCP